MKRLILTASVSTMLFIGSAAPAGAIIVQGVTVEADLSAPGTTARADVGLIPCIVPNPLDLAGMNPCIVPGGGGAVEVSIQPCIAPNPGLQPCVNPAINASTVLTMIPCVPSALVRLCPTDPR